MRKISCYLLSLLLIQFLSANPGYDLGQIIHSAQTIIEAMTGKDNRDNINPQHLTMFVRDITLHGHNLPDDIKDSLRELGFNFSGSLVTYNRMELDYHYDFGIFRIHYNTNGEHAVNTTDTNSNGIPDYIDNMASVFTFVYNQQINIMGFNRPPSDQISSGDGFGGSDHYDIYLSRSLGPSFYGMTVGENYAQGNGDNENSITQELVAFTSYIHMCSDYQGIVDYFSNKPYGPKTELEAIKVTVAHEFFHAVQYGYDGWEMPWLLESTAVQMEEELFDDINDCYQYLNTWFQYPHESLDKTGGAHWYGSYIYFHYISEHLGGHQTIKLIIEEGVSTNSADGDYSHQAIDDALASVSSSFSDALNGMAIANKILSPSPGFGAEQYSYEEAEDFPVTGPRALTTVSYSAGDPSEISSTSLNAFGSQYINLVTDSPVSVELINEDGPQSDLQLHSVLKTSTGYHLIKSGNVINIDPGTHHDWLTLIVVSQDDAGNDFDYRLELTDGVSENVTLLPFTLDQPQDGSYLETLFPVFTWHPTTSIHGAEQITYKLGLGINPESMDTVYVGQDTSYSQLTSLRDQTLYHWTVFAENISGNSLQNDGGDSRFYTAVDPLPDQSITISKPYPNPFPSGSAINWTRVKIVLQEETYLSVIVVNGNGQQVADLFTGRLQPGFYDDFSWNGRMSNGKLASSGTYFIGVKYGSKVKWQKVTLLR